MKKTIDVTDVWIAGLFDGEGCVQIVPSTGAIVISFGQSFHPILDPVFKMFPEARGGYDRGKKKDKWKKRFILSQVVAVKRFLVMVQPYVIEKKDQVRLGLEYIQKVRRVQAVSGTPEARAWAERMSDLKKVEFPNPNEPVARVPDFPKPLRALRRASA